MSEKKLISRWLRPTIALVVLVMPQFNSARVENVVVVMPKGPRTLQMLGSISPQLLHTISDVLKPVPSNVVQIPIPYYPEYGNIPPINHPKHYPTKALNSAYFKSPFAYHVPPPTYSTAPSYNSHTNSFPNKFYYPFNFDIQSIQPGPYDTPFIPKLKPSPVNPLHLDNPPEIRFTPINLLPPAPPSFDTIRNYVQKLKAKQKDFFDTQGFEYGLFTQPNTKPTTYHRPVEQNKKQKYKHKPKYEALFSKHPNELSYIGNANLEPQNDDSVYYTEPDAGTKFFYANADGHEFVLPPQADDFKPIHLDGIVDPEDAHFEQHGDQYLLKTKHPNAAAVTAEELDDFIQNENEYGFASQHTFSDKWNDPKAPNQEHHRNKRYKKFDRVGRANGDQDVEADFYDSDEGKKKFGELDFDDAEEEVRAHENFEPKKTYTQVRHQETTKIQPKPQDEPKIKEKVTISRTNIVYSEKGKEDEHFDHGREESFGEFRSKSKKPKKHRSKRGISEVEPPALGDGNKTTDPRPTSSESDEDSSSRENELDYEYSPEYEYMEDMNDTESIYLPYAQALVFQNDTDMFLLPIPEALVDPRELHGEDLLNFLDEAIKNSTEFLPPDEEKVIKISPEIQSLQGADLIQYLDEAIKTSNQYLVNGPEDAIELVNPPRLGGELEPEEKPAEPIKADHVFEYEMEAPKPEDIHGEVLRYTQQQVLPDAPEYEAVSFVQPFKTLLRYHKDVPQDYEIEFESQEPRTLQGEDLLRYLDEAIGNTTLYLPEDYDDSKQSTPYLNRAFHYVDVDTALKYAENITTEVSDYLNGRIKKNEVHSGKEGDSFNDNGFVPVRSVTSNAENVAPRQPNSNGLHHDGQQKQSNPAVAVYNDVIRHIKNHMSVSKTSKSKNSNVFMIAVPRSMRANLTRKAQRREDGTDDGVSHAQVFSLPIFDITQFYPAIFSKTEEDRAHEQQDEIKQALEQEAERLVEKQSRKPTKKDQSTHEQRLATRAYYRDDISEAFRERSRYRGPHPGPQGFSPNSYDVKEKIRDYPQPTFKKPGPPYTALPQPPSSSKQKQSTLNAASSQRAVRHHPPPHHSLPHKRKRTHKRPRKTVKRVPAVVRTKLRIIKR
ncbi:uncharacterized protein LOC135708211 [Ochlerotatus camptorhynchus]|uniref:uncharacterized protein LOC135708211 n=1 Tax=Ochlerotatus camptorhynchus TaxID=644619 RepID=UPI0031D38EA9